MSLFKILNSYLCIKCSHARISNTYQLTFNKHSQIPSSIVIRLNQHSKYSDTYLFLTKATCCSRQFRASSGDITTISNVTWRKRLLLYSIIQSLCFLDLHPCIILYIKPNWCTIFLSMFISFLYMFRATM
jgi:hypothetical protein